MIEERVAERDELSDAGCGGEGRFDDFAEMRPASSMVASCSSSLEPKWAYTPLLLMLREPAR